VDAGAALNVAISASDADGNGMTFSQTGLPTFCGLTDNLDGTGSISCNPAGTDAGTYATTVTVTDNGSPSLTDSESFDIVVTAAAANQAPVLSPIGNRSVDEGSTLTVTISASDPDGDGAVFSHAGLPAFCDLTDTGNGSASIVCSPRTGHAGSYSATITVTDSGTPRLSDSETFNIFIRERATTFASSGGGGAINWWMIVMLLLLSVTDRIRIRRHVANAPCGFCTLTD
jgi:hypothetical protein